MAEYIPGVCNINAEEIAYRRKAGNFMLALSVIITVLLIIMNASFLISFILIVPFVTLTTLSYLQAKNAFCVKYAGSGQENASESSKSAKAISNRKNIEIDKAKANKMYMQSVAIGIIIALIVDLFL